MEPPPSCHYTPHHKWTASEWEERSRRPYLVSDSAGDASKPHKLLLNVCQWYRIGYCWIFNSLTVVWCHCLSAPVCSLAFSPLKIFITQHTCHKGGGAFRVVKKGGCKGGLTIPGCDCICARPVFFFFTHPSIQYIPLKYCHRRGAAMPEAI